MLKKLDIYKMTVEEFLERGAKIDINFHENENYEEAYKKVALFDGLNKSEDEENNGAYWVKATESSNNKIEVTAFYDKKSRVLSTTKEKNIQL